MTTIKLENIGAELDKMQKQLHDAALKGVISAVERGLQEITTNIIASRIPQPFDRGIYRSGWKREIFPDGASIENNEPHAAFIEYGVRPENVKIGAAMITALAAWAVRKGLTDTKGANQVAWAIAKRMQSKGIFNRQGMQGLGILKELVEKHMDKFIDEEISREIEKVIK